MLMKKLLATMLAIAGATLISLPSLRADDTAAAAPESAPAPSYHASITKLLANGKDVISVTGKLDPAIISTKKYLFIYQSAHWCPPCRAFTPKLVAFYNKNYSKGDFELIFVSSDRSQSEMNSYMKGEKMPWFGLKQGGKAATALKKKFQVNGIPSLTLVDENDKIIAHSYDSKGNYLGPATALTAYMKLHPSQ